MQSLGERFGRRRIVMDLLGDAGWPIGTPPVACFWALDRGVACNGGRFAVCGLAPDLRKFSLARRQQSYLD